MITELKVENNKLLSQNLSLQERKQVLEQKVNQFEQEYSTLQIN